MLTGYATIAPGTSNVVKVAACALQQPRTRQSAIDPLHRATTRNFVEADPFVILSQLTSAIAESSSRRTALTKRVLSSAEIVAMFFRIPSPSIEMVLSADACVPEKRNEMPRHATEHEEYGLVATSCQES